ncbi:MAG: T9SS type A sorting domain-containing protein, partial [Bacteroidales bacterium]
PWSIDPWIIELPYTMTVNEVLPLNVKINMIVDSYLGELVVDTLDIFTENGHHKVILKVDSDLITSINDPTPQSSLSMIVSIIPNPFNSMTCISFSLDQLLKTSLIVYTLQGQMIMVLADQTFSSGKHELVWNRKDRSGNEVKAGIYLVKLITEQGIDTRKLIVTE